MSGKQQITAPTTYLEQLRAELRAIETDYESVLAVSAIQNIDPNRHAAGSGVAFVGYAIWGWAPSDDDLERAPHAPADRALVERAVPVAVP